MRSLVRFAHIQIRDLLDLVAATDPDRSAIGNAVHELYDWHNSRGIAGLQLTFGPIAGAVVALATDPSSEAFVIAVVVLSLSVAAGVVQLFSLSGLHREFTFALVLCGELTRVQPHLREYPHGDGAPAGSVSSRLYGTYGSMTMFSYRRKTNLRQELLDAVRRDPG